MKRQKLVFGSHSQLCHIWAQQQQASGRASRMFFENYTDIYSYGRHYLAAKIHTLKGKQFALVRSDAYSVSTSKHLSEIRSSLQGLMPYFCVKAISTPKEAVKQLDQEAQERIALSLKKIKIENVKDIKGEFESIWHNFTEANKLRKILGMAEKWPSKKQLAAVDKHLKYRLQRYKELNTPEQQAKREAKREYRKLHAAEIEAKKQASAIAKFRAGASLYDCGIKSLPYDLLRTIGGTDQIQTSRGAYVPYKEARLVYRAIKAKKDVKGLKVGNFTCIGLTPVTNGDMAIKVGCHNVLLSEAKALFEQETLLGK